MLDNYFSIPLHLVNSTLTVLHSYKANTMTSYIKIKISRSLEMGPSTEEENNLNNHKIS